MASVLVTGAAGFIGFHVSQSLLREGHRVVGLDSFTPYYDVALKRARVAQLTPQPGFTLVEQDICDYEGLRAVLARHGIERVCHLAAQAGVRYSIQHPFSYQKSNLEGFLAVLEACRHGQVARLVYASSSSVYGGSHRLPFSEDDPADSPVSLYAATKRANELMAHSYTHLYQLPTVGLRFFTVYGPWGRPDMAMWLFADAMLAGRPLAVFNGGDMQRDFTYVDDIVQGVIASLFRPNLAPCEVINLGNNSPEDLREVIRLIAKHLGVTPRLDPQPIQPGDVRATYADIRRAQEKLDFAPSTPIALGIPRFLDWFRAYRGQ
jgi:UDP-glucuronate 4-epimerase